MVIDVNIVHIYYWMLLLLFLAEAPITMIFFMLPYTTVVPYTNVALSVLLPTAVPQTQLTQCSQNTGHYYVLPLQIGAHA
jgi:hypothetical protein